MLLRQLSEFFYQWPGDQWSGHLRKKHSLLCDQRGATAIEYVLLLATVALVGVLAAGQIADSYKGQAGTLETTLSDAENRVTTSTPGNTPIP